MTLPPCPGEGHGVNDWTFATACELTRRGVKPDAVGDYLRANTTRRGYVAEAEIERAVERAPEFVAKGRAANVHRWPDLNQQLLKAVLAGGSYCKWLMENSPVKSPSAADVFSKLFREDELVWAAYSVVPDRGGTKPAKEWLPWVGAVQFVVPNPMAKCDVPPGGRSSRCLANVGTRRWLVIESDEGTRDDQAAVLLHLAKFAPLAVVASSGGKSLHGWFHVAGRDERSSREFMEYAVSLRADRATWNRVQPVRMPGGIRQPGGKRQDVLFFNPEVAGRQS
jgi:hypothetical protein